MVGELRKDVFNINVGHGERFTRGPESCGGVERGKL